ncbi:hypothetical protein JCM10213_002812 [Rhodosporidiobolus nylandii]
MPKHKTTIQDLPPEVITLIVEAVEHIAAHGPGTLGAAGAGADDAGLGGMNAGDALAAMFGGLFGGLAPPAAAGAAGGPGQAAGGAGAANANAPGGAGGAGGLFGGLFGGAGAGAPAGGAAAGGAGLNPNAPAFTFGAGAGTGANGANGRAAQQESDSDSDMPPLEPVPTASTSSAAPPATSSASGSSTTQPAASTSAPSTSNSAGTPQPAASTSTSASVPPAASSASSPSPSPSASRSPFNFFGLGGSASSAPSPSSSAAAAPVVTPATASASSGARTGGTAEREPDSDEEMPPLTPIPTAAPSSGPTPSSALATADSDDDMPPLEPISSSSAAPAPAAAAPAAASTQRTNGISSFLSAFTNPLNRSAGNGRGSREQTPTGAGRASGSASASAPAKDVVEDPGDPSDEELPPLEPISSTSRPTPSTSRPASSSNGFSFGPSSSSSRARPSGTAAAGGDSDDDMPRLEAIPSASAAKGKGKVPSGKAKEKAKGGDESDDSMPALEAIPSAGASTAKGKGKAKAKGGDESDDSMPPLEAIPSASSGPAKSTVRPKGKQPLPAFRPTSTRGARKPYEDSDSEMPTLERIPGVQPQFTFEFTSKYAADKSKEVAAKLPPLPSSNKPVPSSSAKPPTTGATVKSEFTFSVPSPSSSRTPLPSTSSSAAAPVKPKDEDEDDDLPPLEPIDGAVSPTQAPASSAAPATPSSVALAPAHVTQPASTAEDEDEDMPPLEPVGGVAPPPPAGSAAAARAVLDDVANTFLDALAGGAGEDGDAESGWEDEEADGEGDSEGDEDEDEDEGEDEDEDEDEYDDDDEYDSDDSEAPQRIYPDGLPTDPLLPLLFINRSFLHAARKLLYRRVHVAGPYVASLLLSALQAKESAGYLPGDEGEKEEGEEGERSRNTLRDCVRTISFDHEGDASLGRGGARVYIDIIAACDRLENLVLRPMLLKSATKPLIRALEGLSRLKSVDLTTSTDPAKPFVVTVPRLYQLMKHSWPELERLTVQGLKSGDAGPVWEDDEMWEEVEDDNDDADTSWMSEEELKEHEEERKNKVKCKGLQKIELFTPDASYEELEVLLSDSKQTLDHFSLHRPGFNFTRFGLASTLLTFGAKLTVLDLGLPSSWYPTPKPGNGVPKKPFPVKPKGYKPGNPTHDSLIKISEYHFLLDAIMPYLPNLKELRFDGPHASTSIFSFFPPSLSKLSFGHCTTIQPAALAKLLRKSVTRTKQVVNADGAKVSKSFTTKVARGLTCMSINHDDLQYSEADIRVLEQALEERSCCLHLSGDAGGFGGAVPLGGLGGLWGGALGGGIPLAGAGAGRIPVVPIVFGGGAGHAPAPGGAAGAGRR